MAPPVVWKIGDRLCEEAEAVLDEEEAVKESIWVECEEEMVRCLVSDGWGERVGGGDDDKRKKKKKRVLILEKRKRVCCVLLSAAVLFPYARVSIFKE
ncbi:hypothetical protein MtrunA17_Chr3g0093441 [Medicago truncatula]|uniref:Transmembrane protein, putative n=1 Tax=Medicago truncatula TaxID=3880 RepID=G7J181_MEDTR|nr:transmembrane protein, putative [Medicago truncatula]RHN66634.1 hypothetical protein MtrunA17_Chr3g0093441 [Medicago truncatula]